MKAIRRILVPTDLGDVSARALDLAIDLARCLGAELHLLHVDNRSLAGNLAGIISQRLVRRLCPDCRVEGPPDDAERRAFEAEGLEPPAAVGRPVGCPACRGTGYRGRVGVFEAVVAGGPAAEALQRGAPEDELRRLLRSAGTPSLLAAALDHARAGVTSIEEARGILWA